jgi:hypothetical protein
MHDRPSDGVGRVHATRGRVVVASLFEQGEALVAVDALD